MTKLLRYLLSYVLWIVDLGLALWLLVLSRRALLGVMALSYQPGNLTYAHQIDFADKLLVLVLGMAWLGLMIFLEKSYRSSALTGELLPRFARVTGVLLFCVFGVDLILFWAQGVQVGSWLRGLLLVTELGLGTALLLAVRKQNALRA